jgi:hypothetical protein
VKIAEKGHRLGAGDRRRAGPQLATAIVARWKMILPAAAVLTLSAGVLKKRSASTIRPPAP